MNMAIRGAAVIAVLATLLAGCSQTQDGAASSGQTGDPAAETLASTSAVPTVLVLDSSGSMSEPEGDGTRMDATQTAATGLVDVLPDGAVLGLVAYGTSTGSAPEDKGAGCADVKTLHEAVALDLGAQRRSAVTASIDGLAPSGYTPIATSLRQAAELLPQGGEAAIVLLSDGEETCAPPSPCDVARELKQDRPGLTISTVGFKTANEELSCIAQATGGLYLTADNTDQLVTRLLAAQNVAGNANTVTPTGFRGLELGQSIAEIQALHADFPGLGGGRADGADVVIVWMDCDWVFADKFLQEIRPHADAGQGFRTVDGLETGAPISKAVGLYGEPVSKQANPDNTATSLFTASKEAGTAWKIGHKDDVVNTIYLCRCLPGQSSEPQSEGDEVVGGTTIKRLKVYKADGSLRNAVARPAGFDFGCKPMAATITADGLHMCGKYMTGDTTYFCSQSQGMAICPVLDSATFISAPVFATGSVVWTGDSYGPPVTSELPWAIELVDGTACEFGIPMGAMHGDLVGAYQCGSDEILWAPMNGAIITEAGAGWTVQAGPEGTRPLRTATVKTAVFLIEE